MKSLWHPATAISLVALFLGGTGGAIAAREGLIPGAQIKPHSIPLSALTPAAVASLRGHTGIQGPAGPMGAAGVNGTFNPAKITRVASALTTVAPGQTVTVQADCPPGAVAIGGGGAFSGFAASIPTSPGGTNPPISWAVLVANPETYSMSAQAVAVCASP